MEPRPRSVFVILVSATLLCSRPAFAQFSQQGPRLVGLPSADLAITKSVAGEPPFEAGKSLTYAISVVNNGPDAASGVTVTDTLPAGMTFVSAIPSQGSCSGTATVICAIGTLANGSIATITLIVTTHSDGVVSNTATVSGEQTDPNPANNESTVAIVVSPSPDLAIAKSVAGAPPFVAGSNLTYTIGITNNGPILASNVVCHDTLPAGTSFVSATPSQGSCGGGLTVTCAIGTLANGGSATITLVVRTASTPGQISNTATASSGQPDPNPANNSSTATITTVNPSADLTIVKLAGAPPFAAGANVTYTIGVVNNGPDAASGVTVTDTLPAGTSFVSATPSQGTCSGTTTVTCAVGTLANGGSATINLVLTTASTPGTVSNTATVTATEMDPIPANNSYTSTISTIHPASIPFASAWILMALAGVLALLGALRNRA